MVEYFSDNWRVFDGSYDFHLSLAVRANDVDVEEALKKSRPTDPLSGGLGSLV